jgi:hypothetical protein
VKNTIKAVVETAMLMPAVMSDDRFLPKGSVVAGWAWPTLG